ncbi:DUF1800 domain-containing protein [Parashewanella curva]|uniref:DUF1800 domain-containing protein n=1 Tax=Parashewanella curva TaxID=2338552 RepID=A0A3L8PUC7_9GAMM|nr:DUF1800 domain-containing protein [Parashewanella curva]RLV58018.1 DUF1800 domain-containing protein [Parashewanella curva]
MSSDAVIAVNRFGMGARKGELEKASRDPVQYLIDQLQPISFNEKLPNSDQLSIHLANYQQQKRLMKKEPESEQAKDFAKQQKQIRRYLGGNFKALCCDTLFRSIHSEQSLAWRLLDFWSNHFSVTTQGQMMRVLAPTLEREAIAPHMFGHFHDMVLAVMHHPAMLVYLNNDKSFGPNSKIGKRGKGLNENLGRELMELHTMGVGSGYTQADVIEMAKGITGWSVARPQRDDTTGFMFRANGHEPGHRVLLGKTYRQGGETQGIAMIKAVARHPATAKHVSTQLARHFVSDNPPESLIKKMTDRWKATDGNLKEVMITLIKSDEAWHQERQKFKSPREYVISTCRALNFQPKKQQAFLWFLKSLGQSPFQANSPKGYGDIEADWNGPSAVMSRANWSAQIAKSRGFLDPVYTMRQLLGEQVSNTTELAVKRAESRPQALTLMLMSPEFLRR